MYGSTSHCSTCSGDGVDRDVFSSLLALRLAFWVFLKGRLRSLENPRLINKKKIEIN